jgi:hypothetical protein
METATQEKDSFSTHNRQDQKRTIPRYIIMKPLSIQHKQRVLKAVREK